ncbi:hypothetical protein [Isoptericola variabilis]|uniref:Uncharacterized protein n=1 Tax=Isoptericola variabilis (strain 225) TaxID=743718 RepID=F6FPU1_ISOV2|nr:hypothetical protein [Isoptericola variabilis]AEG43730.1 hypothetical protein Isova_0946 [Isoptericola variabilis 225]TWH27410.1 hypothetical protein L600_000500000830 [Isoptericola variabilis J7]
MPSLCSDLTIVKTGEDGQPVPGVTFEVTPEPTDGAGTATVVTDPGGRFLPEVSGTAEPGTFVEVLAGDQVASTVTAGDDDAWASVVDLAPGEHVLAVRPADAPDEEVVLGDVVLLAPEVRGVQYEGSTAPVLLVARDRGPEDAYAAATVDGVPTEHLHVLGRETVRRQLPPLEPGPHEVALRYDDPETGRRGAVTTVDVGVGAEDAPTTVEKPL